MLPRSMTPQTCHNSVSCWESIHTNTSRWHDSAKGRQAWWSITGCFSPGILQLFHCLVMPCHFRARLQTVSLSDFFLPYRDERSRKGPCWWAEKGDGDSEMLYWLSVSGSATKNMKLNKFNTKCCTYMKGMYLWVMIIYTFRKVLISSFLQRSNLVTLCSSHCCTTALLSAESPSRPGHLLSSTKWQAMVTSPTSGGPLLLCRTGTCIRNDTQRQRARGDNEKKGHFIRINEAFHLLFLIDSFR